ncbi:MAG: hypothetical protein ACXWA3_17535 [Acidimicrobiales bacterium]
MNQLERAASAVLERPVASPAPVEVIGRRAAAIRRRRRVLEIGAIALVVLVLGTAGLVLGSLRGGDHDQGVFVGEGPGALTGSTVSTYHLSAPVDSATASALLRTLQRRLFSAGQRGSDVVVDGTLVTVTSSAPAETIDALVTSPAGFELRPVQGDLDAAVCDSAGGHGDDAQWTSAVSGPPRCLGLLPAIALPDQPTKAAGMLGEPDTGYQVSLVLTAEASQAVLDARATCTPAGNGPCGPAPLGVATDGVVLDPAALLQVMTNDGPEVQVTLGHFADQQTASFWSALLASPLPAGVRFTSRVADPTTTTTSNPAGRSSETTARYRLQLAPDATGAEALKQAIEARFRWYGKGDATVDVTGSVVSVTTEAPSERTDRLVTASGGFELRPNLGEIDPSGCDTPSTEGASGSASAGSPSCYRLGAPYQLPRSAADGAGYAQTSVGDPTYGVTLELSAESGAALREQHLGLSCASCLPETVAVLSGGSILRWVASVRDTGAGVEVALMGFVDPDEASFWAAVLTHPLPDGVSFSS